MGGCGGGGGGGSISQRMNARCVSMLIASDTPHRFGSVALFIQRVLTTFNCMYSFRIEFRFLRLFSVSVLLFRPKRCSRSDLFSVGEIPS